MTMKRTVDRNVLKAAVGRQMFCPMYCGGRVLDAPKAVLIEDEKRGFTAVLCHDCADKIIEKVKAKYDGGVPYEVTDGRRLWK